MTDTQNQFDMNEKRSHPRKPWLAVVLSLLATGLGQVYNGHLKRGIGFLVTELLLGLGVFMFMEQFVSMLIGVSFLVGFNIFVIVEAFRSARSKGDYSLKPCNKVWVYILVVALGIGLGQAESWFVKDNYIRAYTTPSGSMLPTLRIGDMFMARAMSADERVQRGDIVIFSIPGQEGVDFVKRVVGLPGDTLEIRDKVLMINGNSFDEPYVQHTKSDMIPGRDNLELVVLGQDDYFVMGDNREGSYDSRFTGPVTRAKIKYKAMYLYFPADFGSDSWGERLGMELR